MSCWTAEVRSGENGTVRRTQSPLGRRVASTRSCIAPSRNEHPQAGSAATLSVSSIEKHRDRPTPKAVQKQKQAKRKGR